MSGACAVSIAVSCAGSPPEAVVETAPQVAPIEVTFSQGTNMSLALSPDQGAIIAGIQGTLWTIPAEGGTATALTEPEMDAHEPVFSPDGSMVAFYAYAQNGFQVFTMKPDGSEIVARTSAEADSRYPSFSPDGASLLYSNDMGEGYSVYRQDLSDGETTLLIDAHKVGYQTPTVPYFQGAGNALYPILSPDQTKLAFVVDGAEDTLMLTGTNGENPVELYKARTLGAPVWSADGSALYVVGLAGGGGPGGGAEGSLIAAVPADGSEPTTVYEGGDVFAFRPGLAGDTGLMVAADGLIKTVSLADGSAAETPFTATVSFVREPYTHKTYDFQDTSPHKALGIFDPALSPDGSKLVFTAIGDLWMLDLAGEELSQLTDDPAIDLSPTFSPDGTQIAFVSDRDGKSDIWIMTLDGGALEKVTDLDMPPNAPSFSPDGKKIAFLKDSMQAIFLAGTVEVLDLETSEVTNIGRSLFGPSQPDWSPSGEKVAVIARRPDNNRFREGHNAVLLLDAEGVDAPTWVSPVEGVSLGRRQWVRPAWGAGGELVYRVDGELWSNTLTDDGELGDAPLLIAEQGENPNWSADGSKLVYLDGGFLHVYDKASATTATVSTYPTWTQALPDSSMTIRAGRMFDAVDETVAENVDIVVENGTITAIRPAGSEPVVGDLVDASGSFVMPGLVEQHTHQSTSLGRALGQRWFRYGITSVRETGTAPYEAVERREAEAAGRRPGPRVFAAGPLNEGSRVSYGVSETVGTPEAAEEAVARSTALNLDMLKSYVRQDYETQKTIIAAAHASGIPVSGHELYPAIANGVDQMEHVGATSRRGFTMKMSQQQQSYEDVINLIAKSGLIWTPTFAIHSGNGSRDITPLQETVGAVYKAGGRLVAGTDSPFITYADSLHTELRLLVGAGIPPSAVLKMVTNDNAVALGAGSEIGTIEVGKLADIVVIDGDPLTNMGDTENVAMLIKNGEVVYTAEEEGAAE